MESGFEALQQAAKAAAEQRARAQSGGGSSALWLPYFTWKDDDSGKRTQIVRFIDDRPLVVEFFDNVVCKDGNTRDFILDPDKGDFITKFGGRSKPYPSATSLEDATPRKQVAGLAVLRKEVPIPDQPGEVTYEDQPYVRKIKNKDGSETEIEALTFGIVKQSLGNFWDTLIGYFGKYQTLCDRDYEITRIGTGLDTQYRIIPCERVKELSSIEAVHERYRYGQLRDENDPKRFFYCPVTLKQWGEEKSSEEYAKRWLTNTSSGQKSSTTSTATTSTDSSNGADEAQANGGYESSGMDEFAQKKDRKPEDKVEAPEGSLRQRVLDAIGSETPAQ